MVFPSRPTFSLKKRSRSKDSDSVKIVPQILDGVSALHPTSDTMKGVLDWLKSERLHKYWPLFSHMSYTTIVGLTESTFDDELARLGAGPITCGAKCRILRCTERLRGRFADLENINELTPLDDVADIFQTILTSPLSSTDDEPNGHSLLRMLRAKFDFLIEIHGAFLFIHSKFGRAYDCFLSRPEVPGQDKEYVQEWKMTLVIQLARFCRSAGKRTIHPSSRTPTVVRPATSSALGVSMQSEALTQKSRVPGSASETPVHTSCAFRTVERVVRSRTPDVPKMSSETTDHQSSEHTQRGKTFSPPSSNHRSCSLRLAKFRNAWSLVDVRKHPYLPVTLCRSEPSNLDRLPFDNFICQPLRPVQFPAPLPMCLVLPRVLPFVPFQPATPQSYPTSSATSLSSLSDTSDGQSSDDSSWPADHHLQLLMKITRHSANSLPIDSSIDLNRTWGGVENQVMIDIACAV